MIDPAFINFAPDCYKTHIEAVIRCGGKRAAARELGVHRRSIDRAVEATLLAASRKGFAPEQGVNTPAAPGYAITGTSTLRNGSGEVVAQWVKTSATAEDQAAAMQAALEAMVEQIAPLPATTATPGSASNLCTVYTLTDSHVGMLANAEEGGAEWNLDIAENVLTGVFERLVASSPPAGIGVVAQLGDFLHSDGLMPVTPTSHHVLDVSGRFSEIVRVAVRILRRVVAMALQQHDHVVVLMAEGNHDISSSVWLRAMFSALYENEPRVTILNSELPYYAFRHGQTMLCWHHGHLRKNEQLPALFAATHARMWGETTKRYCHTGHRHHQHEKEHPGMTVIQHSTLSARDAYAARGGWTSERQATAITYHSEYGQVSRQTVTPEMLF